MNTTYLDMIRGTIPVVTPVWYMRQAGRSQASYRKIKEKYTLFEITRQPELCATVTKAPVDEYGVDAAILYKDIMSPMAAMDVDVSIKPGVGPVFDTPIRTVQDVERLQPFDADKVSYIADTIRILTSGMLDVPLIGFAGAPFTLASYLVEGGPTKNYNITRGLMVGAPQVWHQLMTALSDMTIQYLAMQIEAGVQAVQIFDSWIGAVSASEYERAIEPHMARIITTIRDRFPHVPVAMNGVGTAHLMPCWKRLPLDIVSLDWRCSIAKAHSMGMNQVLQGNLDPAYLYADESIIQAEVDRILEEGVAHGRHIFNLGHGIFPEADPGKIKWITDYVHEKSRALRGVK